MEKEIMLNWGSSEEDWIVISIDGSGSVKVKEFEQEELAYVYGAYLGCADDGVGVYVPVEDLNELNYLRNMMVFKRDGITHIVLLKDALRLSYYLPFNCIDQLKEGSIGVLKVVNSVVDFYDKVYRNVMSNIKKECDEYSDILFLGNDKQDDSDSEQESHEIFSYRNVYPSSIKNTCLYRSVIENILSETVVDCINDFKVDYNISRREEEKLATQFELCLDVLPLYLGIPTLSKLLQSRVLPIVNVNVPNASINTLNSLCKTNILLAFSSLLANDMSDLMETTKEMYADAVKQSLTRGLSEKEPILLSRNFKLKCPNADKMKLEQQITYLQFIKTAFNYKVEKNLIIEPSNLRFDEVKATSEGFDGVVSLYYYN